MWCICGGALTGVLRTVFFACIVRKRTCSERFKRNQVIQAELSLAGVVAALTVLKKFLSELSLMLLACAGQTENSYFQIVTRFTQVGIESQG